jgi:hypothetical protein
MLTPVQIVFTLTGFILSIGGCVILLMVGHPLGFAPFLAGAGLLVAVSVGDK